MKVNIDADKLTQEIKAVARHHGAVLVGVASIDRFEPVAPLWDQAPRGRHPRDWVPGAKSVISIAQPVLDAFMEAPAAMADEEIAMLPPDVRYSYLEDLYNVGGHKVQDRMLEDIAQIMGQELQAHGFSTMYFPTPGQHPKSDPPLEYSDRQMWEGPSPQWSKIHNPFRYVFGAFSHRHAAVRAGLGEFGYVNVVLTPEFGPRQRFNTIITEAELVPDPLLSQPVCLREQCQLCLKACPMDAITMRDDSRVTDYRSVEKVDRNAIFIDTPAKTDPTKCKRRAERMGNSSHRCFYGDCIRICPVPAAPARLSKRLQAVV